MKRLLLAELKQETATFNPAPTTYDDFRIHRGEEIRADFNNTATELSLIHIRSCRRYSL